jgi:PPOX class probable F420-dependent enzyme
MAELSDLADLLEKPNHAVLSTLNADGSVHSTIIWINREDDNIAFNSARGRVWPANLERDPRVTLTLLDESDPYTYAVLTGSASWSIPARTTITTWTSCRRSTSTRGARPARSGSSSTSRPPRSGTSRPD